MTILNTITYYDMPSWLEFIFYALMIISFAGMMVTIGSKNIIHPAPYIIFPLIFFCLVIFGCIQERIKIPSWEKTKYEVVLDEDYSYRQLEEHYNVLGVRGQILTVEEKE